MKYVYTAVFNPEPGREEVYNVSFPDLPGCITFGESLSEAIEMAEDALCLWLYHQEQTGDKIPLATNPFKIKVVGEDFITAILVDTDDFQRYFENKELPTSGEVA